MLSYSIFNPPALVHTYNKMYCLLKTLDTATKGSVYTFSSCCLNAILCFFIRCSPW
ncbi:unnamed protein product, partial [Bubo scandiacus]